MSNHFAFCCPRFGPNIAGGAETLVRELALKLQERGDQIDILTTCAVDNRSWSNELEPGEFNDRTLTVRRFKVDERDLEAWIPRQINISEGLRLSVDDQLEWMQHSVNSSTMLDFIRLNQHRYSALFFAPYLFGTTFWGSLVAPEKSLLISCLHDESYAYLELIRYMFRRVKGVLFNAPPEQELANRLYCDEHETIGEIKQQTIRETIRGGYVGMGFEPTLDRDKLKPYFEQNFPYLLYLGRKETGKNVHLLLDQFIELKLLLPELKDLKLVIAGAGSFNDLERPEAKSRSDILDLSHLSEHDKLRLIRHALALTQPSTNESFSIVLMESWLLETPVIVNSKCAVTSYHVNMSQAGFSVDSTFELGYVLRKLLAEKELGRALGQSGFNYVRSEYSWGAVLKRFDQVVSQVFSE